MVTRSSAQIKFEIIEKLGFFPPFFEPALSSPAILENLWFQTLTGYVENPLPNLFKEKLAALLARYCTVPYCLMCHSSSLRPLGMNASEVLEMLEQEPLGYQELAEKTRCLKVGKLETWPVEGSDLEDSILYCSVAIYLGQDTELCQENLRSLLPENLYDFLILYIAYNKTALCWAEAHPELNFRNDKRVQDNYEPLVTGDPKLADFFANYQGRVLAQNTRRLRWLTEENKKLVSEERDQRSAVENEQARLIRVFNAMPNPVAILSGPTHLFTFANAGYEQILLGGKSVVGKTVAEAVPEAIEQGFGKLLDGVYETGKPYVSTETPIDLIQNDGSTKKFFLNILYEPVRDADGAVEGLVAVVTDVTEQVQQRKLLEESAAALGSEREKLARVFDLNQGPLALWRGADLVYERVTPVYQSLFPERKLIGARFADVLHEERFKNFVEQVTEVFKTGTSLVLPEQYVQVDSLEDGKPRTHCYDITFVAINDPFGNRYGVLNQAVDITEAIAARKALEAFQVELQTAKAEADSARKQAEDANALKSAFLANMSHEIRTPLGAMIGFADLLRDQGVSAAERSNYVNIMLRNGEQLSVIINDILDLSKVEAGYLTLEYIETDHRKIGAEVVSLMQVKAREKDLALEYSFDESTPKNITSDPTRIRQILLNLVSNAIKFTQYGTVRIRTYGCKAENGSPALCFEVNDSGIGMSTVQIDRLFQTFTQADETTTRRFGGTGLGLALSRKLARALGGDITVKKSVEGGGTTFLVRIADEPEKSSAPEDRFKTETRLEPEIGERALAGLKILVVDDAPDNQALIWRYLTKRGATVESAENGLLGFRAALSGSFDLVLMDIQMPIMDGYTATQKLRDAGYMKPIIALTAHAMNEIRKKALNVGYTDHLTKPINPSELIQTIVRHTANSSDLGKGSSI